MPDIVRRPTITACRCWTGNLTAAQRSYVNGAHRYRCPCGADVVPRGRYDHCHCAAVEGVCISQVLCVPCDAARRLARGQEYMQNGGQKKTSLRGGVNAVNSTQ